MSSANILVILSKALKETLYMTSVSTLFAYVIGLPLGVLLLMSSSKGIRPMPVLNKVLGLLVNSLRSLPFLILLVAVLPLTRKLVGTTIGASATIPPLVIASAPFVARLVEQSLAEIDPGLIEAAQAMGANTGQIIYKVLLPEAKTSLLNGAIIASTTILSYSALAGFTGGGGLGAVAVNYGYHRYQTGLMLVTVFVLIVLVQIIQILGKRLVFKSDARKIS